jgi:hypothetical protein
MARRKQRYSTFAAGELVYLLEHQERLDPGAVLSQLEETPVIRGLGDLGRAALRNVDPERILSLERPESGGFNSIVFLTITRDGVPLSQGGEPIPDKELLEMVYTSDRAIARSSRRKRSEARAWTGYSDFYVGKGDEAAWKFSGRQAEPFAIRAVSPNWLFAATPPIAGGTGGPGGRPVPLTAPASPLVLPPQAQAAQSGATVPVEVAILDTAPSLKALESGYNQFVANTSPRNDLLAALLGPAGFQVPNPALRITYDSTTRHGAPFMQASVMGRDRLYIEDHDYVMNDHGSFIAGIIYELTHSAKTGYEDKRSISLHLVQVLNDFGIGSLETIARGLMKAWNSKAEDAALVINCSFMLPVPRHKSHPTPKGDETFKSEWKRVQESGKSDFKSAYAYVERWTWIIDYLCSLLRAQGVSIVAAAGNDGGVRSSIPHPEARFPAAFRSVIGVAALAERGQQTPADYSNKADNPLIEGFSTFGGLRDSSGFTDTTQGVPGVYIGTFPAPPASPTPANTTGYAMWAGTSFAAPIISAALALSRANALTPEQAAADLRSAAVAVTGTSVLPIA